MAKLYTRTGDGGDAGLIGGERLRKDHARFEALGALDELNAAVGFAAAAVDAAPALDVLHRVQGELLTLGAMLAGHADRAASMGAAIERLEKEIDGWSDQTPALTRFVLPGGCESAARLHLARAVCRRAERRAVALGDCDEAMRYLNRLSDWLFALARFENHESGGAEIVWG